MCIVDLIPPTVGAIVLLSRGALVPSTICDLSQGISTLVSLPEVSLPTSSQVLSLPFYLYLESSTLGRSVHGPHGRAVHLLHLEIIPCFHQHLRPPLSLSLSCFYYEELQLVSYAISFALNLFKSQSSVKGQNPSDHHHCKQLSYGESGGPSFSFDLQRA